MPRFEWKLGGIAHVPAAGVAGARTVASGVSRGKGSAKVTSPRSGRQNKRFTTSDSLELFRPLHGLGSLRSLGPPADAGGYGPCAGYAGANEAQRTRSRSAWSEGNHAAL